MLNINPHALNSLDTAIEAYHNEISKLERYESELAKLKNESENDTFEGDLDNIQAAHARVGERETKIKALESAITRHKSEDQEQRIKRLMDDLSSANTTVLAVIKGQVDLEREVMLKEAQVASEALGKIATVFKDARITIGKTALLEAIDSRFEKELADLRNSGKTPLEVSQNIAKYLDEGGRRGFLVYNRGW